MCQICDDEGCINCERFPYGTLEENEAKEAKEEKEANDKAEAAQ